MSSYQRKAYPKKAPKKGQTPQRSSYQKKQAPRYQKSRYLAPALGYAGQAVGTYYGGAAGGRIGRQVGRLAGHGFKTLTGYGDYTVRKNTLSPGHPPSVYNGAIPGGAVIISHKEFLGDVISSASPSTFDLTSYPINPGLEQSFPWLGQVAGNFQQYKIMGMAYEFRSMSADALNSTNTALGQIIMATNYDALAPLFQSKAEMENSAYAQSVKPSSSCLHLIECDTSTLPISELYLRTGDNPANSDLRMYDLGNFQIATNGFQGTSVNAGELWVTYQIMLLKPKITDATGEDAGYFIGWNTTSITNGGPLGTNTGWAVKPGTGNSIDVEFSSSRILVLPTTALPKSYQLTFTWVGTRTASLVRPDFSSYTNASIGESIYTIDGGASYVAQWQAPDTNAASDSTTLTWVVNVNTVGNGLEPRLTLGAAGTLPASVTSLLLVVQEIPHDAQ